MEKIKSVAYVALRTYKHKQLPYTVEIAFPARVTRDPQVIYQFIDTFDVNNIPSDGTFAYSGGVLYHRANPRYQLTVFIGKPFNSLNVTYEDNLCEVKLDETERVIVLPWGTEVDVTLATNRIVVEHINVDFLSEIEDVLEKNGYELESNDEQERWEQLVAAIQEAEKMKEVARQLAEQTNTSQSDSLVNKIKEKFSKWFKQGGE